MVNLGMAVCWLILGAVLLAWHCSDPTGRSLSIWGTGISLGWFAVAMALYNLFRWYLSRPAKKGARRNPEQSPLRGRPVSDAEPAPAKPMRDPSFDFTTERPGRDPGGSS